MVSRYRLGGDQEAWGGWLGVQMLIPPPSLACGAGLPPPAVSVSRRDLGEGLNLRAAELRLNPPLSFPLPGKTGFMGCWVNPSPAMPSWSHRRSASLGCLSLFPLAHQPRLWTHVC